jgi:FkbM family methyltransferase
MSTGSTIQFLMNHPLTRHQRVRTLARFVRWQIASRLVDGPIIMPWVSGSRFLATRGEFGVTGNIYAGLHEFKDMAFLLHYLRKSDLFVDIGANVGSYTILAAAAVGSVAIAIEPVPQTFDRLIDNVRANRAESAVQCRRIGISDSPGVLRFTSKHNTMNRVLAPNEHCPEAISVEVLDLDSVLLNLEATLMKIDVEGYETNVLRGAVKTLGNSKLKAVIIELNGSGAAFGYDERSIVVLMREFGFRTFHYDPFERELVDLDGGYPGKGNTLFVRDLPYVVERLHSAPRFNAVGVEF